MLCYGYGYAMLCYALLQQQSPHPAPPSLAWISHALPPNPPTPACIVLCCAMLWRTHNSHVKRIADRHNAHEEGNETSSINITKEFVCAMLCYAVLSYLILSYAMLMSHAKTTLCFDVSVGE